MYPEYYDSMIGLDLNSYRLGTAQYHIHDIDEDEYDEIEFKIPAWVKLVVSTLFVSLSAVSIIALSVMVA